MEKAGAFRRFLSLKWKALLLTSVPLIGIALSLSALSHFNLVRQYNIQRAAAREQYRLQVSGLIEQSSQRLQQLGSLMPTLTGMQQPLLAADSAALIGAFNRQWSHLQIDMGVELVRFYSKSNGLLGSWGSPEIEGSIDSSVLGWVWHANEHEEPVSLMSCSLSCTQFAIVPILIEGRSAGIVLLGRSMADVILGFKQVSGTDIGVFVPDDYGRQAGEADRGLPAWKGRLVALTDADRIFPVLQQAARQGPQPSKAFAGAQIGYAEREYEVSLIPLKDFIHGGEAYLVVVADITGNLERIAHSTRQSVVTGIAGLIAFEALLLALLWAPLSRLRHIASVIPLLSQSLFSQAREAAAAPRRLFGIEDESDILIHTTVSLSHQLEKLQDDSNQHALALAHRAEEMKLQKDFISSLVDTAHAVIVTQNNLGEVTMINQHGVTLLGYAEPELRDRPFTQMIAADSLTAEALRELADLFAGRRQSLEQELSVVCKDGSRRDIAWYHSRPPGQNAVDAPILSVGHDITERKMAESRLSWLADHDSLTGLYNRRRFQAELEALIIRARSGGYEGAVLFLDLDQFKDVNDSSGHHAGDSLIKGIGGALSSIVRSDDMVARIGGDEFAIVIPRAAEQGAIELARSVERKLNEIMLPAAGASHCVTASIGIALFPRHGDNVHDVLANADLAMYKAKESGRGCWYLFSSSEQIRERVQERVFWRARLQTALDEDHFELHFQPIADLRSDSIHHFEALLRLREPDGSLVGPATFIGVAEKIGMIHPIDRLVIEKSIRQLCALAEQGHDLSLSVNLSAHAFNDPELCSVIRGHLRASGVDPGRLIFEVTETAAVIDFPLARECITEIRKLGCRFALDDFGVGFSSFLSLKQLPVDYVKIDGSFIRNLDQNVDDQILVRALAQVAEGFGKETVAEFVDSERSLALLREYRIRYAQGYLIGRPLPAEEAFAILDRPRRVSGSR
jgi:diguanylate cyclase (GGDEF)-like protein/PAS domain S-box-containing protein